MRCLLPLLLCACSTEPVPRVVQGRVTDGGAAAPGVPVEVAGQRVLTDAQGRFEVVVEGRLATPPAVVLADATTAVLALDCDGEIAVDLQDAPPRPRRTVDLVLRQVSPPPTAWDLRFLARDGTDREPVYTSWDPPLIPPVQDASKPTLYSGRTELPESAAWAIGIVAYRGSDPRELSQVALLTDEGVQGSDGDTLDLLMSDETIRGRVPWDASGPQGASRARFVQQVDIFGYVLDVPVWEGRAGVPDEVPVVLVRAQDPVGYRAEFDYNEAEACRARTVGVPAVLGPTLVPGWLVGAAGDTGLVEVAEGVRIDVELPSPPVVVLDEETLSFGLRFVPDDAAVVEGTVAFGAARWRVLGGGGCGAVDVPWPEGLVAPDGPPVGRVGWRRDEVWARCDVGN